MNAVGLARLRRCAEGKPEVERREGRLRFRVDGVFDFYRV
jgi:hypothetical protein